MFGLETEMFFQATKRKSPSMEGSNGHVDYVSKSDTMLSEWLNCFPLFGFPGWPAVRGKQPPCPAICLDNRRQGWGCGLRLPCSNHQGPGSTGALNDELTGSGGQ